MAAGEEVKAVSEAEPVEKKREKGQGVLDISSAAMRRGEENETPSRHRSHLRRKREKKWTRVPLNRENWKRMRLLAGRKEKKKSGHAWYAFAPPWQRGGEEKKKRALFG